MTSLNNPVKLPLDANGNVLANINAQNINPNVNTAASVTGAVGSVTGNVGGSVVGSVGSVTGSVTSWTTISHQTGLSAVNSAVSAPVNIGTAIAITKDGKIQIAVSGHVSLSYGGIRIARTRSAVTDYINQNTYYETATAMNSSLFTDGAGNILANGLGITSKTRIRLIKSLSTSATAPEPTSPDVFVMEVLNGDSLQFQVTNITASETIYIDDLVVQQQ